MKDFGGPAFPREDYQTDDAGGQRGMFLRDYFAAAALTGLLSSLPAHERPSYPAYRVVDEAYRFADAMLAERAKS